MYVYIHGDINHQLKDNFTSRLLTCYSFMTEIQDAIYLFIRICIESISNFDLWDMDLSPAVMR
jgi:hypothetical protein